jgi:transglutaminase/protease-like cytokinesis protein 3
VKIDGAWYLLDVTWSSGYLDAQFHFHRFSSPVNTDYFLTDPPQFVKTHFPDDPWWQLLPKPIKESDFLVMAAAQLTN